MSVFSLDGGYVGYTQHDSR